MTHSQPTLPQGQPLDDTSLSQLSTNIQEGNGIFDLCSPLKDMMRCHNEKALIVAVIPANT